MRQTIHEIPVALAKRYPQPTHILACGPMGKGLLPSRRDTHTPALGPARSGKASSVITTNAMAWSAWSLARRCYPDPICGRTQNKNAATARPAALQ